MDCPVCGADMMTGSCIETTPQTCRTEARCPVPDCEVLFMTVRHDSI
jgi:hypothetical protein